MKMKFKKPKYKNLKFKEVKFKGFDVKKPIAKDSDGDKVPDYLDCKPFDPKKQGFLHDLLKKKQPEESKVDLKLLDKVQKSIEEGGQTEEETPKKTKEELYKEKMKEVKEHGSLDKHPELQKGLSRIKGRLSEEKKDIDRSFNKFARAKHKKQKNPKTPDFIRDSQGVNYLIHGCRKMYQDPESGERISIPRFKTFVPQTIGNIYRPPTSGRIYVSPRFHPRFVSTPHREQEKRRIEAYRMIARIQRRKRLIESAEQGEQN